MSNTVLGRRGSDMTKATIQPNLLVVNAEFLNEAYDKLDNIRLTRAMATKIFENVLKAKLDAEMEAFTQFLQTTEEQQDWVETMQNRLRAQTSHLLDSANRIKPPKWATTNFTGVVAGECTRREAARPPLMKIDFDLEHLKIYKEEAGKREWAVQVIAPDDEKQHMMAKFSDGKTYEVPSLCKSEYEAKMAAKENTSKAKNCILWEGKLADDTIVSVREDGPSKWIIRLGPGKQICQMLGHALGDGGEDEAKEIIVELAKDFVAGKIEKLNIKSEKDTRVKAKLALKRKTADAATADDANVAERTTAEAMGSGENVASAKVVTSNKAKDSKHGDEPKPKKRKQDVWKMVPFPQSVLK